MQSTQIAANVSLTTAAANIASIGNVYPNTLIHAFIPNTTGLTATDTVTYTIIRNDTGAVIGSATSSAATGETTSGVMTVDAVAPAGIAGGVTLQGVTSAATATATASATAPIILAVLP